MKKITLYIISVLLFFFVLPLREIISVHAAVPEGKAAAETEQFSPASGSGRIAAMKETSEYALPYPGILPDHPLYILKKIRDAILDKLIVDPVRKTEFNLLQSDKHLNMAILLEGQGKTAYLAQTVRTSNDYMQKAVNTLVQLKQSNKPAPESVRDRVEKSLVKHVQVLTDLSVKTESDVKEAVTKALESANGDFEQVVSLK